MIMTEHDIMCNNKNRVVTFYFMNGVNRLIETLGRTHLLLAFVEYCNS